ncbi:MAG: NADPH-dependent FMN reductase [Thermoleophilia bacterium]
MPEPLSLKIIVASTRPSRLADAVAPWVARRAGEHGAFDVEVLDLRDWPLPFFQETVETIGDLADPTYTEPVVARWNRTIVEGDAFLVVTPEYSHSIPGALKNAIDSVFVSWGFRNKPVAAVGYSVGVAAGTRAIEHLAQIMIEVEAVPLRNSVILAKAHEGFGEDGAPLDPGSEAALAVVLDDLAWWAGVLRDARPTQLPPAVLRG